MVHVKDASLLAIRVTSECANSVNEGGKKRLRDKSGLVSGCRKVAETRLSRVGSGNGQDAT